jgi:hypothetical protein
MSPTIPVRPFVPPALVLGLCLSSLAGGCDCDTSTGGSHQNHTVDIPITGTQLKPYVMLLVDNVGLDAGSGRLRRRRHLPALHRRAGRYDPASANPCKWTDLKVALASEDPASPGFLVASKDLAAFGLAVFPGGFPQGAACETGQTLVGLSPNADHVEDIVYQLDLVARAAARPPPRRWPRSPRSPGWPWPSRAGCAS